MTISSGRLWMGGGLALLVLVSALLWWRPWRDDGVQFSRGDMVVTSPWARATPGTSRIGAVYLTVTNGALAPDRLLRAETPAAERVELHINEMRDGVMRMRPVESIPLPARQPVHLEPGGLHLMLMNLAAPLKQGERFPMRLIFERAGALDIEVTVGAVGASEAPGGAMDHMGEGSHANH